MLARFSLTSYVTIVTAFSTLVTAWTEFSDHGAKIEAARKTITEHTNDLTKKAPIETEAQGNYHKEWLTKIQAHLDSNADVDLMDLRLKQDQLTTTLEEAEPIARRVLGGAHPLTEGMEEDLRDAEAVLHAHEAPSLSPSESS